MVIYNNADLQDRKGGLLSFLRFLIVYANAELGIFGDENDDETHYFR